jgi:hypothetical protein
MTRFSERIGARKRPETIQIDDANEELRTALWNVVHEHLTNAVSEVGSEFWDESARILAREVFNEPADRLTARGAEYWRRTFYERAWHDMYDAVEFFVLRYFDILRGFGRFSQAGPDFLIPHINRALERAASGFRFVSGELAPITSDVQLEQIEAASATADRLGLKGASAHLDAALAALSARPEPDYRTSIKESIHAVESVAAKITGKKPNGLSEAMKEITSKIPMHGAFVAGLLSLYGFTSDEQGIRHAILDDPDRVGFDEAKFMLVACSAFVDFFVAKASAAGLLK